MPKIEQMSKKEKTEEENFFSEILERLTEFFKKDEKEKIFDKEKFEDLEDDFKKRFPEQSEEIGIFFNARKYFLLSLEVKYQKLEQYETFKYSQNFLELTEFNARLTEFIYQNVGRSEYVQEFWETFKNIALLYGTCSSEIKRTKIGLVAQAFLAHVLEKIGYKIRLATPEEDAYKKIDLWLLYSENREIPIQIKTRKRGRVRVKETREKLPSCPEVNLSDKIHYPALQMSKRIGDRDVFVSSNQLRETLHIAEPIKSREKRTGRRTYAMDVFIPFKEKYLNKETGKPTEGCVQLLKEKFDKMFDFLEKTEGDIKEMAQK